jgi:MoaA/NifB/PqqE/SkfB family radical SAM enzyme
VCPRSALAAKWLDGDLSPVLWNRLRTDLRLAEHVHLQGWGEPLLHADLREMVLDTHAAGCAVGVTTNGDLLPEARDWIVAEGVDVLTVSVAGLAERNRDLRGGADLEGILNGVGDIVRRRGSERRPRVHLSYLLIRDNIADLEGVVQAAADRGADAIVVNHLDCTPTAELRELAVFTDADALRAARTAVRKATSEARRLGIELRAPAFEDREMLTCDLDPRHIVSVRWDGRVAPCVHLNLPIDGPVPRATGRGQEAVDPVIFGNLHENTLSDILDGDSFREFTAPLRRRCEADRRFRDRAQTASAWGHVALQDLEAAHRQLGRALAEAPFPEACRGCPKRDGY